MTRGVLVVLAAALAALIVEKCASSYERDVVKSYPAVVINADIEPGPGDEPTYRIEYEYNDGETYHHETTACTQREYMKFFRGGHEMCVAPLPNRSVRLEDCQ